MIDKFKLQLDHKWGKWGFLLIGIIGIVIVNVYLLSKNDTHTSNNKQSLPYLINTNTSVVKKNFDDLIEQFNELEKDSLFNNEKFDQQKAEIQQLKSTIDLFLSKEILQKHQHQEVQSLVQELQKKVISLTDSIGDMHQEILVLKLQNEQALQKIEIYKSQAKAKEKEIETLKKTPPKVVPPLLRISNINLQAAAIKKSQKNDLQETRRVKKADVMRVNFDVEAFNVGKEKKHRFYVRILDPENELIINQQERLLQFEMESGAELTASMFKDVLFNKNDDFQNVDIIWNNPDLYIKGTYTVKIYHNKKMLGEYKIDLK